jgi:hypothetical protein
MQHIDPQAAVLASLSLPRLTRDATAAKADELERKADALYMSLLAPSMKEQALRDEAKRLREMSR